MEAEAPGSIIRIGGSEVGEGKPCFVIAEAGVNHNGDPELAKRLVAAAGDAGADSVKFQTFKAASLVTANASKARYQTVNTGSEESQFEMLKRLELSETDFGDLKKECEKRSVMFLSSPFDEESADFLCSLGVPAFKIPSGEITNLRYLRHIARKRLPMIVSTGMCTLGEVETALSAIEAEGNRDVILLHCVSNYPAAPDEVNLRAMETLKRSFGYPVGYSDHTLGLDIALAAVALGACVLEKHFTLDKSMRGPDHKASLDTVELTELIGSIRNIEAARGSGHKRPTPSEMDTASVARKSFVSARDIASGEVLSPEMICMKRPGTGVPGHLEHLLLGRRVNRAIPAGTLLSLDMLG